MVLMHMETLMPPSLSQEGLHPGPLQELIDNIDKKAEQVRLSLFQTFASDIQHHGTGIPKSTLQAMVSLASATSDSGVENQLAEHARKYLQIQEHNEALQAELKAAQATADLEATLREFETYLENGQYNEAAWSVVQLRKILEENRAAAEAAKVYGQPHGADELAALAAACARCEQALEEALEASCHEAFDVEREGCVATITSALPSGGGVGDLWAAMELAGLQDRHLQWVADTLLEEVLPPVLLGSSRLTAHIAPSGDSAILQWPPCHTHTPRHSGSHPCHDPAAPLIEHAVCDVLHVLRASLFAGRPSTIGAFGALFWGRFVELYRNAFLQEAGGASIEVLRARQEAARDMERAAVAMGLTDADALLHDMLSRAVAQSYHVQQQAYLSRAREVLMAADPRAAPVSVGLPLPLDAAWYERYQKGEVAAWELLDPPSGWDANGPVLATGFSLVNPAVIEFGKVINATLCDACDSGDKSCAQALVVAASKMATMYLAAGPGADSADAGASGSSPGAALSSSPQAALLRHNDLQWLARHLLLLPFLFGASLEELVGGEVWFGDEAARLRDAARQLLRGQLRAQQAELGTALEEVRRGMWGGSSRGGGGAGAAGIAARKAVRQLLHGLSRAGRLVWLTLAPAAALDFSARLLGWVAGQLVEDILGKGDIGVDECGEVGELLAPLAADAVGALIGDIGVEGAGDVGVDVPAGIDMRTLLTEAICQRTWGLGKLRALLKLLNARMADIVRQWEEGRLAAEGLTLGEASHMVKALFEDTDLRAQCLQRMEVAGY